MLRLRFLQDKQTVQNLLSCIYSDVMAYNSNTLRTTVSPGWGCCPLSCRYCLQAARVQGTWFQRGSQVHSPPQWQGSNCGLHHETTVCGPRHSKGTDFVNAYKLYGWLNTMNTCHVMAKGKLMTLQRPKSHSFSRDLKWQRPLTMQWSLAKGTQCQCSLLKLYICRYFKAFIICCWSRRISSLYLGVP